MLLDGPTLAAVAALAVVAATVSGMSGFGAGIILTVGLVPLIGVKAVIPVLAVAGVVINAGRFWFYRTMLDRRMMALVLVASLPFLVLGTWLYSMLDARSLSIVLGIAVMASVPVRRFFHARKMAIGPVGVATLAVAIHEEKDAIEDIYEPFLIQAGFLDRTPRGRVATTRAYQYFGLTPPKKDPSLW